ncbi:hypothetical protein M231_02409 [Tremella mesenterica]|uniref:Uncharacterized protein n=1 Tax=Tremella mesenterica TaxID=5217 RepID=A0A4Q1BQS6_TREME|nr:hypothetical protein M231_02409 [Tremella mesenterica]
MPRRSYDRYLATKALRRRGSIVDSEDILIYPNLPQVVRSGRTVLVQADRDLRSETDLDSVFSHSTQLSNSSQLSHFTHPQSRSNRFSPSPIPKLRSLSSTSSRPSVLRHSSTDRHSFSSPFAPEVSTHSPNLSSTHTTSTSNRNLPFLSNNYENPRYDTTSKDTSNIPGPSKPSFNPNFQSSQHSDPRYLHANSNSHSSKQLDQSGSTGPDHHDTDISRTQRGERRERRKIAKREKSTLLGEKYDSPIRRYLRWMASLHMSKWALPFALIGVGFLHVCIIFLKNWTSGEDGQVVSGEWLPLLRQFPTVERILDGVRRYGWGIGEIMWTSGVVFRLTRDGRREGRSSRTQITGILTILLNPVFLLINAYGTLTSDLTRTSPLGLISTYNAYYISLSLVLFSLTCLQNNRDILACCILSLASIPSPFALCFTPIFAVYLSGKCIWLGVRRG